MINHFKFMYLSVISALAYQTDRLACFVAWALPRSVVHHAGIRLVAHATTGFYGNTNVGTVTAVAVLMRWETSNE